MVVLVALLEATENCDSACLVRFVDHHFLEAALESLIFFKIFQILIEGGSAGTAELAAGQSRLEDVCGVHGALAFAGPHESVDFIDKEDNLAVSRCHFIDNSFKTLLKFALIFGACDERAHVERINLLGAEILWHIASYDTVSQTLGDGCLTGARLANEHRVVLGAARKNLKHAPDFLVTSDHRVEFACAGTLVEVDGILRKRVVGFFGSLVGGFLALAQLFDGCGELFLAKACIFKNS